jgi:hypothetical protein
MCEVCGCKCEFGVRVDFGYVYACVNYMFLTIYDVLLVSNSDEYLGNSDCLKCFKYG